MPKLIIVRGLPGSGKSTIAKKLKESYYALMHWEADMFYETINGYEFDINFIKNAHDWCYNNAVHSLFGGNNVVVSNTFTTNWEMERYVKLKEVFQNLEVDIINVYSQYESIHGVPEETMKKMKARWEEVDPSWDVKIYNVPLDLEELF